MQPACSCFLVIDRRQLAQTILLTTPVIGALDPGHGCEPQPAPGCPSTAVHDILLPQTKERFHHRANPGSTDPDPSTRPSRFGRARSGAS